MRAIRNPKWMCICATQSLLRRAAKEVCHVLMSCDLCAANRGEYTRGEEGHSGWTGAPRRCGGFGVRRNFLRTDSGHSRCNATIRCFTSSSCPKRLLSDGYFRFEKSSAKGYSCVATEKRRAIGGTAKKFEVFACFSISMFWLNISMYSQHIVIKLLNKLIFPLCEKSVPNTITPVGTTHESRESALDTCYSHYTQLRKVAINARNVREM